MGLLEDKYIGLALAVSSSLAVGTSFIITKKGLMDAAQRVSGPSSETHKYLQNPIWWAGMLIMVVGEVANFAAYTFAPPILVTPLGALSVLIGAVLASFFLNEKLGRIGKIGCALCLLGSVIIVLHAPEDKEIKTVDEILAYALHPGFVLYCFFVLVFSVFMIYKVSPTYGTREPIVYISICSLVGSVSVMAIKGFGVAVKLTLAGSNQLTHWSTYFFAIVVAGCIVVQMNYFNKALDQFSTNVVNPIYYVCFSTATIVASLILFRGFGTQDAVNTISLLMGFFVTFLGVYLLNVSRLDPTGTADNQVTEGCGMENGVQRSYHHRSSIPSSANPFKNFTPSPNRKLRPYRSQDSVLFEAYPEESVGLTLMNTSEEDDDDDEIPSNQRVQAPPKRRNSLSPGTLHTIQFPNGSTNQNNYIKSNPSRNLDDSSPQNHVKPSRLSSED